MSGGREMTTHVTAIYENGVLRPTQPLPLKDGDPIDFTVVFPPGPGASDDVQQRILRAKTFDEWIAAADEAAKHEPAQGYELLEALNETRGQAGERLLFPP